MNTSSTTTDLIEAPAVDILRSLTEILGDSFYAAIVTAIIVLLATAFASHLVTRFLRHLLSHENSPLPSSSIFINIARVVMWGIGISIILSTCFGIDVTAAVAALGIGGIALSLGFQDTISNLISGLQVSILGIVQPGDHIEIAGTRGVVSDVNWRQVTVDTPTGGQVVVPNSIINTSPFTKLAPAEKIVTSINVDKSVTNLDEAAAHMEEAVRASLEGLVIIEKGPTVLFDSATEFGYDATIVVWVESFENVLVVRDKIVRALAPFTAPQSEA